VRGSAFRRRLSFNRLAKGQPYTRTPNQEPYMLNPIPIVPYFGVQTFKVTPRTLGQGGAS